MRYLLKSQFIFDVHTQEVYEGLIEVENGWITAIYKNGEKSPKLPVHDYSNQMILPGFIDAHVHYYLSVLLYAGLLHPVGGETEEIVAQQAATIPSQNGWKVGIGWYASDFGQRVYPTRKSLDSYTGSTPTLLISGDAHTIWLNTAAMDALGIREETIPQHITGERMRQDGQLTGVFLEAIAIYYLSHILSVFKTQFTQASQQYMKHLNKMGITAVGDVALTGESPDDLVYPDLYEQVADPTVRISFYPAMREDIHPINALNKRYTTDFLQMGGVKQFFDGVTSSHTAYLKEEYPDPYYPGDVGRPLIPIETQKTFVFQAAKQGWPMRIHAIGDKAIQLTLEFFKEGQQLYPLSEGQYNAIEHLEVMDVQDVSLTNQEHLVCSVQPSHLLVGYETLDEEVGEHRAKQMFPFQTFLQTGAVLGFGTDSPVVIDVSPLESVYYAVARQTKENRPSPCLMPHERLTIAQALVAHTLGAAKALSRTDIGSIEVGKKADFAILSSNVLDFPHPNELLKTQIVATYVDGVQVV